MTIFVTSDTHFGHANIIKYCNRPFAHVHDMNEALVENWNAVVGPDDEVWHLGDFAWNSAAGTLERLNGTKFLITGNHDPSKTRKLQGWRAVHTGLFQYSSQILMQHYPAQTPAGVLLLHGHSHNPPALRRRNNMIDVGVDAWGYKPTPLDEVLQNG